MARTPTPSIPVLDPGTDTGRYGGTDIGTPTISHTLTSTRLPDGLSPNRNETERPGANP
jgi:hypothetical protein